MAAFAVDAMMPKYHTAMVSNTEGSDSLENLWVGRSKWEWSHFNPYYMYI